MKKILVVHGPNLNLLGSREPSVYGSITLEQINANLSNIAKDAGVLLECYQSNHEGGLVERIHQAAQDSTAFILINPAAYTHTSVALRDALAAVGIPFVEIHISNVYRRETFRHQSFIRDLAVGIICGLGAYGYEAGLHFAIQHVGPSK